MDTASTTCGTRASVPISERSTASGRCRGARPPRSPARRPRRPRRVQRHRLGDRRRRADRERRRRRPAGDAEGEAEDRHPFGDDDGELVVEAARRGGGPGARRSAPPTPPAGRSDGGGNGANRLTANGRRSAPVPRDRGAQVVGRQHGAGDASRVRPLRRQPPPAAGVEQPPAIGACTIGSRRPSLRASGVSCHGIRAHLPRRSLSGAACAPLCELVHIPWRRRILPGVRRVRAGCRVRLGRGAWPPGWPSGGASERVPDAIGRRALVAPADGHPRMLA